MVSWCFLLHCPDPGCPWLLAAAEAPGVAQGDLEDEDEDEFEAAPLAETAQAVPAREAVAARPAFRTIVGGSEFIQERDNKPVSHARRELLGNGDERGFDRRGRRELPIISSGLA